MTTAVPGVAEHLALVAQKAVISNVDKTMAELPIKTLKLRIEAEFDRFVVSRSEVAGAWARDTSLPAAMDPDEDINLLVVFRERGHMPDHYLRQLHEFAQLHYPKSSIEFANGVLRLKLLQGRVRLVPAHESVTGMQIPSSATTWVRIEPAEFARQLADKDRQHEGLVLPVLRLAKYWNVRNGRVFSSWELEQKVLAHRFAFVAKNLKAYWFDFMRSLMVDATATPVKAEAVRQMRRDLDELDKLLQADKTAEATARIEAMLPIPAKLLGGPPFAGPGGYKPMKR
ncbi:MAG: SMODS domain-containing nucleotidyltransferase [Pseudomonadota bacterium]